MAFNPMDFFQAGTAIGQAQKSPFSYGAQNIHDIWDQMTENQMKMAQTAAMFKGEKQYEYQTDPTKINAAFENQQRGGGGAPPQVPVVGQNSIPTQSPNSQPNIGGSSGSSNTGMQVKGMKYGIYDIGNPEYDAKVEQNKKIFESDSNLNQLKGILDNYAGNLKSALLQQGGEGGPTRGAMGSVLASLKQPGTEYIRGLQNLKMDASASVAKQLQGTSQGIQRMFQVTSHNIPDNWDTSASGGGLLGDMVTNAYVITEGVKQAGLSDGEIFKMSPQQMQQTVDGFKANMPSERLQALRDHLGEHFGNIKPATTYGLSGQPNSLETNPLIKMALGEDPVKRHALGANYSIGQVIVGPDKKKHRVIGVTDPNNPDLESVK